MQNGTAASKKAAVPQVVKKLRFLTRKHRRSIALAARRAPRLVDAGDAFPERIRKYFSVGKAHRKMILFSLRPRAQTLRGFRRVPIRMFFEALPSRAENDVFHCVECDVRFARDA